MAGIGQRFTSADHSVPWNTQSHYTMGRAMMHECSKPVTTYGNNFAKRPLFGTGTANNAGAATFSDVANLSRPGSSQQNGELLNTLSSGFSVRTPYPTESSLENGPYFNALNYNGTQNGPQRNYSEPSLFPSLSAVNRTVGSDLGANRVGFGNAAPSMPLTTPIALSRNTTGAFSNSIGSENNSTFSTNQNLPSRGVTLDPAEFPPILTSVGRGGNNVNATSQNSSTNRPPLRNYISIMSKGSPSPDSNLSQVNHFNHSGSSQSNPLEFSKQDFPALPGTHQVTTSTTTLTTTSTTCTLAASTTATPRRSLSSNNPITPTSTINVAPSSRRNFVPSTVQMSGPNATKSSGSSNSIQLLPNHLVTNIPKNMIYDQFGMLGLLKLIRVGDYDATLNMLAPGLDLSSLHSNWQTPGELHATFVSPCHDSCIGRPQDMDYQVPTEYLIRHLVIDHLPDPPMNQLSEETLFWLFYNCCREESQLVVAKELYQREWRFHKKEQIWLTRIMGAQFTTDNNSEQGDYYFWDPLKAQKSTHKMTILYSDLDNAPAAFRVSSGTLSAFTSIDLPGGNSNSNSSTSQQQQQSYSHQPHQPTALLNTNNNSTTPNTTSNNSSGNNNNSCQLLTMTTNALTPSSIIGCSPITTSNNMNHPTQGMFNARPTTVQPPIKQQQSQLNSNSLTLNHTVGRANTGQLNSMFVPRSVPVASSTNTTATAATTTTTTTTSSSGNNTVTTTTITNNNNNTVLAANITLTTTGSTVVTNSTVANKNNVNTNTTTGTIINTTPTTSTTVASITTTTNSTSSNSATSINNNNNVNSNSVITTSVSTECPITTTASLFNRGTNNSALVSDSIANQSNYENVQL